MRSLGIHHVSVNVSDVAAAERFYVDVLGLTRRHDRPDFGFGGAWLDAGGQQLHLIEADPPDARGQHLAFLVDDLDGVIAELQGRQIDVGEPRPVGPGHQAFLHDPSGNMIELYQAGDR